MSEKTTESPTAHKRHASTAAAVLAEVPPPARKRARVVNEPDVVLVSSDDQRFPFSSRLLLASSPIWQTLLPASLQGLPAPQPDVSPSDTPSASPAPPALPEVTLPESAATVDYLLQFLEPAPAQSRELEFPRDWELMKALERYSIWRGVDTMHLALKQHPLPTNLLAPAFIFSQLFALPDLAQEVAQATGKRCTSEPGAGAEIADGLLQGVEETGCEGGRVMVLLSWLLRRTSALASIRARALDALRAYDDTYDCEHTCRGITYAHLVDALGTTSRKRLRKLDYGEGQVEMDCKDCDVRWEKMIEVLIEGMKELPECPL